MKVGETVTVYQDPYTKLKPEGEAKSNGQLNSRRIPKR